MIAASFHCFTLLLCSCPLVASAAAASVNLPLGDVNIVVLTDTHSWVGGHNVHHEPSLNLDYGHVVSFVDLLKEKEPDKDIFFVMNGDFNDGTGLSVPYPPSHLTQILKFMPWDALNIGNHEHYYNVNIQHIIQENGFVEHWNGHYLTSNSILAETRQPIGSRFTYLKGKNTNVSILTFGFLYNFDLHCNMTDVEHVEDVVQSDWFVQELQNGQFNAILFLAHMDVQDPLVYVLLNATRSIVGNDMPIQFITGHTHYRGFEILDEYATSFEAGRYLDTIGFVSFPVQKQNTTVDVMDHRNDTANSTNATTQFQHVFLDANIDALKATLGVDDLTTASGSALSSLIKETRQDLGLNDVIACSPQHYYLEHNLDEKDSLLGLYLSDVVLRSWFAYNMSRVLIQATGSFRYDLFEGNVTLDDAIAVAPFTDAIYQVSQLTSGSDILQAFSNMTKTINMTLDGRVIQYREYAMTGTIHPDLYYDLYTQGFSVPLIQGKLANVTGNFSFSPVLQYHEDGTEITVSSLWLDFMEKYWSCDDSSRVAVTNRWLFVLFSVSACVVFFGYRYFSRKRHHGQTRRGYDNAVAIMEDEDMII